MSATTHNASLDEVAEGLFAHMFGRAPDYDDPGDAAHIENIVGRVRLTLEPHEPRNTLEAFAVHVFKPKGGR